MSNVFLLGITMKYLNKTAKPQQQLKLFFKQVKHFSF